MAVDIERRNKRINNWIKENSERINIMFAVGTKERIKELAKNKGVSISEYVRDAVSNQIIADEDGPEIPDKVWANLMEWLKNKGHTDADIIDCIKYLGREDQPKEK